MVELVPNKGLMGKQFRADSKAVLDALAAISPEGAAEVDAQLKATGSVVVLF